MAELGREPSVRSLAMEYYKVIDGLVIDSQDAALAAGLKRLPWPSGRGMCPPLQHSRARAGEFAAVAMKAADQHSKRCADARPAPRPGCR